MTRDNGLDEMGPIDYLVVEFPGSRLTGEGMPLLVDLVDRGIIRILDLTFLTKQEDGSVRGMALADVTGDGNLDLTFFEGVSSGLLGEDDLAEAGSLLEPGIPRPSSSTRTCGQRPWPPPCAVPTRGWSRAAGCRRRT